MWNDPIASPSKTASEIGLPKKDLRAWVIYRKPVSYLCFSFNPKTFKHATQPMDSPYLSQVECCSNADQIRGNPSFVSTPSIFPFMIRMKGRCIVEIGGGRKKRVPLFEMFLSKIYFFKTVEDSAAGFLGLGTGKRPLALTYIYPTEAPFPYL
jgi:hypothetical protein